jgi:hypothetical protein
MFFVWLDVISRLKVFYYFKNLEPVNIFIVTESILWYEHRSSCASLIAEGHIIISTWFMFKSKYHT